jgi:predicted ATPase
MEPVVRTLILKGFRNLWDVRIDFDNPTFLVGRNGSGKSNVGDALRLLSEAMSSPLREVIDRRGGITNICTRAPGRGSPPKIGFGVELGLTNWEQHIGLPSHINSVRYAFELSHVKRHDFMVSREQCVFRTKDDRETLWFDRRKQNAKSNIPGFAKMNSFSASSLAIPAFGRTFPLGSVYQTLLRMKVYAIEPAALREMQDPDSGMDLSTDGRNAASVFEELKRHSPGTTKRIREILSAIVPGTSGLDIIHRGKKLAIEFTQESDDGRKLKLEAFNMSDGTLRVLGLLLAVFQAHKPSLVFIDEPEASVHPGAAGVILDMLRHAASTTQVVISTQSPEILDAKWIEDKHIRSVVWRNGVTNIGEIPENAKRALRTHLMGAGELFRSEALEPSARQTSHSVVPIFEDFQW